MEAINKLQQGIVKGEFATLARALTLVENNIAPAAHLLRMLVPKSKVPVIGITGPPGAGKSTLVNAITSHFVANGRKVAILAVDPTSPFNHGSLLGDRIRMSQQFNSPNVFIRSVATRGALGGISTKTIEMVDVLRAAAFDMIIVETVGVGQSELEIAGLADRTVVVLVPESGDEIQHIKSGLMEIAQAFVVNKADRDGADAFAHNLMKLVHQQHVKVPVFKTVAHRGEGISLLCDWLLLPFVNDNQLKHQLMAEKAFKLISHYRMASLDKEKLRTEIKLAIEKPGFNIYNFIDDWI